MGTIDRARLHRLLKLEEDRFDELDGQMGQSLSYFYPQS